MKNKSKQIIKPNPNSQSNTILIEKIEKKKSIKKNESIRLTRQTRNLDHETGTIQ
jgi:hypothetical protein